MNKLTLAGVQNFALTTDALAFMQDATEAIEKLAALGGDDYIVTGCIVTGTSVSSGWMVLKGKLMPFLGGTIQSYVRIIETVQTVTVDIASRQQTTYHAEFGTSSNSAFNVEWIQIARNLGASVFRGSSGSAEGATKEGWYKTAAPSGSGLEDGITIVRRFDDNRIYQQFIGRQGYTAFRAKEGVSWSPWRTTSVEGRPIGTFNLTATVGSGWSSAELCRLRIYDRHVFFEFSGQNTGGGAQLTQFTSIPSIYRPNYKVPGLSNRGGIRIETTGEVFSDDAISLGFVKATANWFID